MARIAAVASDQYGNRYAAGDTNEAVQMHRVSDAFTKYMRRAGHQVFQDSSVWPQDIYEINRVGVDAGISFHSNASGVAGRPAYGTLVIHIGGDDLAERWCAAVLDVLGGETEGADRHMVDGHINGQPPYYNDIRESAATWLLLETQGHDGADIAQWIIDNTDYIGWLTAVATCRVFGGDVGSPDGSPQVVASSPMVPAPPANMPGPLPPVAGVPGLPPFPLPRNEYFGLITGPHESHGGWYAWERPIVKAIQRRLIAKGYVPGISDVGSSWAVGVFEQPTADAVARFQRAEMPGTLFYGQVWWDDYAQLAK